MHSFSGESLGGLTNCRDDDTPPPVPPKSPRYFNHSNLRPMGSPNGPPMGQAKNGIESHREASMLFSDSDVSLVPFAHRVRQIDVVLGSPSCRLPIPSSRALPKRPCLRHTHPIPPTRVRLLAHPLQPRSLPLRRCGTPRQASPRSKTASSFP